MVEWSLMYHFFGSLLHWNRCNLLKQAPFTACNMYIDPEPFIAACTQMLCNYPPVDGLKCQFLEAYIRSCSIHHNITVEGWKSQTGCCKAVFYYALKNEIRKSKISVHGSSLQLQSSALDTTISNLTLNPIPGP